MLSPQMSPTSFNNLRCCESVDRSSGSSSTLSPQPQVVRRPNMRRICTRVSFEVDLAERLLVVHGRRVPKSQTAHASATPS